MMNLDSMRPDHAAFWSRIFALVEDGVLVPVPIVGADGELVGTMAELAETSVSRWFC